MSKLINYCNRNEFTRVHVAYDAPSIYQGHKDNLEYFKCLNMEDDDIIVLCHDDVDVLSNSEDLLKYLDIARKPNVGFVGVAGSCYLPNDGAWWNARKTGNARGFVFQGSNPETMMPNYFGKSGQVVVLDGCFLAITYKNLRKVGLDEPEYLETGWDFYDIHMTYKAHLDGYSNYAVPIIIMHESPGMMREGWYTAKEKFMRHHIATINYSKLPADKTNGLP